MVDVFVEWHMCVCVCMCVCVWGGGGGGGGRHQAEPNNVSIDP